MDPVRTPILVAFLFSAGLAAVVSAAVWKHRPRKGSTWLSLAALGFLPWGIGEALIWTGPSASLAVLGAKLSLVGVAMIPVSWFLFSFTYTGRDDWLTRHRALALWTVAATFVLAVVVNPAELLLADPHLGPDGYLSFSWGPLALLSFPVFHGLMAVGNAVLVSKALRSRNVYRQRTSFLIFINVALSAAHVAGLLGMTAPAAQRVPPLVFLGIGALSLLVIYNYRFLELLPVERVFGLLGSRFADITPIARDVVIEEMGSGVVVLDDDNRIVDVNPVARRMYGKQNERIVGKRLEDVVDRDAFDDDELEFLDPSVREGRFTGIWAESNDGERRCYDVIITDLSQKRNVSGRVGIIHDVTDKQRREKRLQEQTRELQRQNDHLEQFASIVSHDLRNPLNVATGRLDFVESTDGADHVETMRDALERMEGIIADVMELATLGQTVEATEQFELAALVRDAWETVETTEATLEIDVEWRIDADRSRLRQVFENLFRNAVQHGGDDVHVTVGTFENGLYVEDDGPGIPADEREQVLKEGFTTHERGTGLGLSIVQTIVEAHGWEIRAAENPGGGARFEIHGPRPVGAGEPTVAPVADD